MSQVKSGFRLAGLTLLFLLIAGLFFAGVEIVCFPSTIEPGSFISRYPAVGWLFLIVSMPIMIVTVSRWVRVLAGFLALAVLNGILSISTGHVLANPTQPIPRLDAVCLTVFYAAAAALASTLRTHTLSAVDRLCVLGFVSSFVFLVEYEGTRRIGNLNATDFILMGIGLSCLLAAWIVNRSRSPRVREVTSPAGH